MPMPRWFTKVTKHVFNPRELKKGHRPVLTHVGRVSGETYRTPLDAHAVDGGYVFVLVYGAESDWCRNILAAGRATLTVDGRDVELTAPRVIDGEAAWQQLPSTVKPPPRMLNIDEYLRMDHIA